MSRRVKITSFMMFQEFTWQQFLVAAMVLSVIWLLGVWLICWRPLPPGRLNGGRGNGVSDGEDALPHSWADEVDALDGGNALDDGLMGKPALEHGVTVLEADEFSFVPVEETEERSERSGRKEDGERVEGWEANLPLDMEEVQVEIEMICRIMEREDGSKEDFFALFKRVKKRYPRLAGSELRVELNDYIREQVPFYLSEQELDSLWA